MSVRITGTREVLAAFDGLAKRVKQRIIRDSMRQSYKPAVRAAKQFVNNSTDTGTLNKSIGAKESNRPARCLVVIGPRRRMGRYIQGGRIASRAFHRASAMLPQGAKPLGEFRNPVKYGHLVEFGHNVVRWGRIVGYVQPSPFMAPAYGITRHAVQKMFERQLARRVLSAVRK